MFEEKKLHVINCSDLYMWIKKNRQTDFFFVEGFKQNL